MTETMRILMERDGLTKEEARDMMSEALDELEAGNYVIAGGDFNQSFSGTDTSAYPFYPGSWAPGIVDETQFSEDLIFVMDNSVPTCRNLDRAYAGADKNTFQYYMIDGFIVSENIDVISCTTLDHSFECSDHNPVIMEIQLK